MHAKSLLQIPNFLHLTPVAIAKHCEALKRKFTVDYLITLCMLALQTSL